MSFKEVVVACLRAYYPSHLLKGFSKTARYPTKDSR